MLALSVVESADLSHRVFLLDPVLYLDDVNIALCTCSSDNGVHGFVERWWSQAQWLVWKWCMLSSRSHPNCSKCHTYVLRSEVREWQLDLLHFSSSFCNPLRSGDCSS